LSLTVAKLAISLEFHRWLLCRGDPPASAVVRPNDSWWGSFSLMPQVSVSGKSCDRNAAQGTIRFKLKKFVISPKVLAFNEFVGTIEIKCF